jgi:hypothetical protein
MLRCSKFTYASCASINASLGGAAMHTRDETTRDAMCRKSIDVVRHMISGPAACRQSARLCGGPAVAARRAGREAKVARQPSGYLIDVKSRL